MYLIAAMLGWRSEPVIKFTAPSKKPRHLLFYFTLLVQGPPTDAQEAAALREAKAAKAAKAGEKAAALKAMGDLAALKAKTATEQAALRGSASLPCL